MDHRFHCITLVVIGLLLGCAGCTSQANKEILTQAHAEAWVSELMPLVENAAGRKFKKVPECRVLTTDEWIKLEVDRLMVGNKALIQKIGEYGAWQLLEKQAESDCKGLTAAYDCDADTVFIASNEVEKDIQAAGIARNDEEKYIRAVIAHELTHALCDQYNLIKRAPGNAKYWIPNVISPTNSIKIVRSPVPDGTIAKDAVYEGVAKYVEYDVAKQLGLEEVLNRSEKLAAKTDSADADIEAVSTATCRLMYSSGKDFIAWHYKNRGSTFVWRILANPPATSYMIFHPETYSPTVPTSQNYCNALSSVEKHFGNRQWKVEEIELGAMKLREAALELPEKDREKLIHCDYVKDIAVTGKGSSVRATLTVFDSPGEAAEYLNRVANPKNDAEGKKPAYTTEFDWIKADKTSKREYIEKKGNRKVSHRDFFAIRGKFLVRLDLENVDSSQKDLVAAFNDIFSRLPKEALQSD